MERSLTFGGDEELLLDLVSVGITEVDDSKRGTTAGVVDDVTNDTLKVIFINHMNTNFFFLHDDPIMVRQPLGANKSLSCGFSFFKLRVMFKCSSCIGTFNLF